MEWKGLFSIIYDESHKKSFKVCLKIVEDKKCENWDDKQQFCFPLKNLLSICINVFISFFVFL